MYAKVSSIEDALNIAKECLLKGYTVQILPFVDGYYVRRVDE